MRAYWYMLSVVLIVTNVFLTVQAHPLSVSKETKYVKSIKKTGSLAVGAVLFLIGTQMIMVNMQRLAQEEVWVYRMMKILWSFDPVATMYAELSIAENNPLAPLATLALCLVSISGATWLTAYGMHTCEAALQELIVV